MEQLEKELQNIDSITSFAELLERDFAILQHATTTTTTASTQTIEERVKATALKLQADPQLALSAKDFPGFIELIHNLQYLFGIFEIKDGYKGSGEDEVFLYHKAHGKKPPTTHKEKLDFVGEKDLGSDVSSSYYSRGSLVARCFWHVKNKPTTAAGSNKKAKTKGLNSDAPALVVVCKNGQASTEQIISQLTQFTTEKFQNVEASLSRTNMRVEDIDDTVDELQLRVQQLEIATQSSRHSPPQPLSPVDAQSPQQYRQQPQNAVQQTLSGVPTVADMVLEVLGQTKMPLSAREIMAKIKTNYPVAKDLTQKPINEVVYKRSDIECIKGDTAPKFILKRVI